MIDVTCAILIITPSRRVLLVHPTNAGFGARWSLPKGIKEINETEKEAAIRECFEETGIDLKEIEARIEDLGRHSYVKGKDYHLFLARVDKEIQINLLECTTHFTDRQGNLIVEVDLYTLVGFEDALKLLNPRQAMIISRALSNLKMELP